MSEFAEGYGLNFDWMLPSYVVKPRKARKEIKILSKDYTNTANLEIQKSFRIDCKVEETAHDSRETLRKASAILASENQHIWIAKSTAGAKGEGISISTDIENLIEYVDNGSQAHVIQKYLENPMLLSGRRKFDIRCWVLLDHKYDIYLYREGVLRTASDAYNPNNLNKITSHLTNHCLQQKLATNFGDYEEGNEMFFKEFSRYLRSSYDLSLKNDILPQIKRIIKDCVAAAKEKIETTGLNYASFQLFGFDFIIDDNGCVYLLEINGAPACAKKLLPELAQSLIAAAINPLYPPPTSAANSLNLFDII